MSAQNRRGFLGRLAALVFGGLAVPSSAGDTSTSGGVTLVYHVDRLDFESRKFVTIARFADEHDARAFFSRKRNYGV